MNENHTIHPKALAAAAIPALRAAGKFVVATYDTTGYTGHSAHDSHLEASVEVERIALRNNPGERAQLLESLVVADEAAASEPPAAPDLAAKPVTAVTKKPAAKKSAA